MKKVYLHIGHGKTGTSSLQSILAAKQKKLAEHKVLYPAHPSFQQALRHHVSAGNIQATETEDWLETIVIPAVLANPDYDTFIFSSESLFWHAQPLLSGFKNHRHDLQFYVILCTRNPIDLVCSTYQQAVKRAGYTQDIDYYIESGGFTEKTTAQTASLLDQFDESGIPYSLLNYSRLGFAVAQHIAVAMKIDKILQIPKHPGPIVNRSLSTEELQFIIMINSVLGAQAGSAVSDALVSSLPKVQAARLEISHSALEVLQQNLKPLVEKINLRLATDDFLMIESPSVHISERGTHFLHLSSNQSFIAAKALEKWFQTI
jgi:hypothetical protein